MITAGRSPVQDVAERFVADRLRSARADAFGRYDLSLHDGVAERAEPGAAAKKGRRAHAEYGRDDALRTVVIEREEEALVGQLLGNVTRCRRRPDGDPMVADVDVSKRLQAHDRGGRFAHGGRRCARGGGWFGYVGGRDAAATSNEYAPIRGLRQAKGPLHVFDRFGDEDGGLAAELGLSFVPRGDAAFERQLEVASSLNCQLRHGGAPSVKGPMDERATLPPRPTRRLGGRIRFCTDLSQNGGLDPWARALRAERAGTFCF